MTTAPLCWNDLTSHRSHLVQFAQRLQAAVLAMPMARTLGLRFVHTAPGAVTLEMPILESFCFRPGQLQATAVYALGDFAAVAAAGSLLPPGWANATVDGTVNTAPAAHRPVGGVDDGVDVLARDVAPDEGDARHVRAFATIGRAAPGRAVSVKPAPRKAESVPWKSSLLENRLISVSSG